jgi:poly(3-hydroxybutyrate) depolymerase
MRRKPKQALSFATRLVLSSALLVCVWANRALGQTGTADIVLKTASHHPIQYYLSLPEGWTHAKKWPVVFAIEGGLKNFRNSTEVYTTARKHMPFIIVSPVILTDGGGDDQRNLPEYHYATEVWDQIDKTGICAFDHQGLDAIMTDLRQEYGADEKYFITGHSAGAHLTWAMVLMHPEKLVAAATSCGNFSGRCITKVSSATERVKLPVRAFQGEVDEHRQGLEGQFAKAREVAAAHGYTNISFEVIKGAGHIPLADQVLAYFSSLLPSEKSR